MTSTKITLKIKLYFFTYACTTIPHSKIIKTRGHVPTDDAAKISCGSRFGTSRRTPSARRTGGMKR